MSQPSSSQASTRGYREGIVCGRGVNRCWTADNTEGDLKQKEEGKVEQCKRGKDWGGCKNMDIFTHRPTFFFALLNYLLHD